MVGALNTKYLSSKNKAHSSYVNKVIKCTVEEAAECIHDYEGGEPIEKTRYNMKIESSHGCT